MLPVYRPGIPAYAAGLTITSASYCDRGNYILSMLDNRVGTHFLQPSNHSILPIRLAQKDAVACSCFRRVIPPPGFSRLNLVIKVDAKHEYAV